MQLAEIELNRNHEVNIESHGHVCGEETSILLRSHSAVTASIYRALEVARERGKAMKSRAISVEIDCDLLSRSWRIDLAGARLVGSSEWRGVSPTLPTTQRALYGTLLLIDHNSLPINSLIIIGSFAPFLPSVPL